MLRVAGGVPQSHCALVQAETSTARCKPSALLALQFLTLAGPGLHTHATGCSCTGGAWLAQKYLAGKVDQKAKWIKNRCIPMDSLDRSNEFVRSKVPSFLGYCAH